MVTHHTIIPMHKLITSFVTALALVLTICACSQEPEVVDVTTLKTSPEKFTGKRIKFYLDAVLGALGPGAEPSDPKGYLRSFDPRIADPLMASDFRISMVLTPDLSSKWVAANLEEYHQYTVTLTGTLTAATFDKLTLYNFFADDFVINADNENSDGTYNGAMTSDGLPSDTVELPQPTRVTDVNKIGLFPDQFKAKPLLIEAVVSRGDFKPGSGDTVQLQTSALTFVLSKELAASIYDKVANVAYLEIVGTLDAVKAPDGSPLITVRHLRLVR